MALRNLRDLYREQLLDLYAACKSAMPAVTEMAREASAPALAEALIDGNRGIARGIDEIARLLEAHELNPSGQRCKAMDGLVEEARRQAVEAEFADDDTRDAAIISQYQRMVHYALAGYGCLSSFAARLDLDEDAAALQVCLDRTRDGDRRMTAIAEDGGVNARAAEAR